MAKNKKKSRTPPEPNQDENVKNPEKPQGMSNWISWAVLVFSLIMITPVIISAIFPALFHSTLSSFKNFSFYTKAVNGFEIGELGAMVIAVNVIVLILGLFYYKQKPNLRKLFDFDISRKNSLIVIAIIIGVYVAFTASELTVQEEWTDLDRVEDVVINRGIHDLKGFDLYVRYSLLSVSYSLFDNMRVVPFIGSIALLITTFYLTREITNKNTAGILSMLLVLQSNIFLTYDTSATYSNFWILFYVVSLILILKKWYVSHASFVLSIFSKSLSIAFLPMSIFFIFRNTSSKKRLYLLASYGGLIILGIIVISLGSFNVVYGESIFVPDGFWKGFATIAYQLRFDPIILTFLLPLGVTLFLKSRKGLSQADSALVLISGFLMVAPLLVTFTSQTNEPYRLMPLVIFFAIGAGTLLAKIKQPDELLSK